MADPPKLSHLKRFLSIQAYALPALLLLAVTLPHLGQGDFRGDTGWYSAIGLQAWRTGQFWTLESQPGQPYFNKPPLAFWIHGLVLHLMGPSVFAARLPTVAAALGCVLATVAVFRELCGRRAGMLAGCVLALSIEFFRRVREISLDMWQLLFVLLAVLVVVRAVRYSRWAALPLAGVPLGLALLTKPLVALVFLPIMAGWLVWIGGYRRILWLLGAGLVACAVAAPWHVSMVMIHGDEFTGQYFGTQVIERAAGRLDNLNAAGKNWWFYLAQIGERYWPWLIPAGLTVVAWARGRSPARNDLGPKFAVAWTVVWLILLSAFADRRDRYGLPLYPGLAGLAGMRLACRAWLTGRSARKAMLGWFPVAVAAAAIVFAALPLQVQRGPDKQWTELFAWARQQGLYRGPDADGLWQGASAGAPDARVFLEFGRWPRATRTVRGKPIAEPPSGSLVLYHRRGTWEPGENESVVFTSGDLRVTRRGEGPWRPVRVPDPGE